MLVVVVKQAAPAVPVQSFGAVHGFGADACAGKRALHEAGVVGFFAVVVLQDVHQRCVVAVFPAVGERVFQTPARICACVQAARRRPAREDSARFGVTGGGIGVVFVGFEAACVEAEVQPSGDGLVATVLP